MNCQKCNLEISVEFKHALQKNECPACGSLLMSQDTLSMLDDIRDTILEEANIRKETAQRLAMTIVTKYRFVAGENPKGTENIKTYSSSKANIAISAEDVMKEDISDAEREKIFEEALQGKYSDLLLDDGISVVEQEVDPDLIGPDIDMDEEVISRLSKGAAPAAQSNKKEGLFSEDLVNPYVEQKMKDNLLRQKQNMGSGAKNSFRRA